MKRLQTFLAFLALLVALPIAAVSAATNDEVNTDFNFVEPQIKAQ